MSKKKYVAPHTEVVLVNVEHNLLTTSDMKVYREEVDSIDKQLSRQSVFDWDDDFEEYDAD